MNGYTSLCNRPRRPRKGVEIYLNSFFNLGHICGIFQRHVPASLHPGNTRSALYWRLVRPQDRFWTGEKNLASTEIRSPDRPSRSELLYRLSYPSPNDIGVIRKYK